MSREVGTGTGGAAAGAGAQEAADDGDHVPPQRGPRAASSARTGALILVDEALDWVRAIGLGFRDTVSDVIHAGREGARETTNRYWARYDRKTRQRK